MNENVAQTSSPARVAVQRSLRGTTILAAFWVGWTVYGALAAIVWPPKPLLETWVCIAFVLIMAWAVLERKRWGRLALLGTSTIVCADLAYAAYRLATAPPELARQTMGREGFFDTIFGVYGCGVPFGIGILTLSLWSVLWLSRRDVKREFAWRKRASMWSFQVGIAGVFVLGTMAAIIGAGATQDIVGSLERHRREATQASTRMAGEVALVKPTGSAEHR